MLMQEPTEQMIKEWKSLFKQYKDKIQPNKKAGLDIINYLANHYTITELKNDRLVNMVASNIQNNEFSFDKLKGTHPLIRIFQLNNVGKNKELYQIQDDIFKGITIIVGIELKTSFIFVEGSSYLYDELTAYTGLDADDIKHYFLTAQYIKCKEKFKDCEGIENE